VEAKTLHKTNTVIKVKVPLFVVCQHWLKLRVHHYITMAHHDRCIRELAIALAEKGGLPANTAGELYGVPMSTARECLWKYRRDGQVMARLWVMARFQPSSGCCIRDLKAATGFPGQKDRIILRL
jgi:hypothetical protein